MDTEIVPLAHAHLEEAAALFAQHYRSARAHDPHLAPDYEEPIALQPRLKSIIEDTPGVAALQDGRLVGFLYACAANSGPADAGGDLRIPEGCERGDYKPHGFFTGWHAIGLRRL